MPTRPTTPPREPEAVAATPPRIWTPPPPRSGSEGRPSASSVIAELWSEREQKGRPRPAPSTGSAPPQLPEGEGAPPAERPEQPGSHKGNAGLIAAIIAVAVVLGSGLGVFVATSGGSVPSKSTFTAKADGICSVANAPLASVTKPSSYPELATAVGTVAAATDTELDKLHKVSLPTGSARTVVNGMLGALLSADQAAHDLQDAAGRKDDAATAKATSRLSTQFDQAGTMAKAFGFTACATGMQAGVDNVVGGAKAVVKSAFMAKADALCREGSRNIDALAPFKNNSADLARYLGQGITIVSKLLTDLQALPAPPGDEATVSDMLAAQGKVNAKTMEMRDAAAAGDQSRFAAASQELTVLGTAADAKLDAYGLTVCGSNFGSS